MNKTFLSCGSYTTQRILQKETLTVYKEKQVRDRRNWDNRREKPKTLILKDLQKES